MSPDTLREVDAVITKLKIAIIVILGTVVFTMGGFVYGALEVKEVQQRVTVIENSPCYAAFLRPDDAAAVQRCEDLRAQADRVQSLSTACIQFRRVLDPEALALTRCSTEP